MKIYCTQIILILLMATCNSVDNTAVRNQLISNNYGIHRSKDGKNWEQVFKTESMAFFDLINIGEVIYGGTRYWDEYRSRNK